METLFSSVLAAYISCAWALSWACCAAESSLDPLGANLSLFPHFEHSPFPAWSGQVEAQLEAERGGAVWVHRLAEVTIKASHGGWQQEKVDWSVLMLFKCRKSLIPIWMLCKSTGGQWGLWPDCHPFQEQDGRKVEQIMLFVKRET